MAALSMDGIPMTALPNSADQITFDNTGTGMSATMVDTAIKELKADKAETDIVAADFNPLSSYTAGNYCIHEGKFYKFKNNHSGAWSASDVDEIKIAGELSTLKSGLTYKVDGKMIQYLGSSNTIIDVSNVVNIATLSVGNYQDAAIFMIYKESGTSIFMQKLAGSNTLSLAYSEPNKLILQNANPAGGTAMLTYPTSY